MIFNSKSTIAIVTGSSRGIGKSIKNKFETKGNTVIGVYRNAKEDKFDKKCDLGETTAMDGNLICSNLNVATPVPVILKATVKALANKLKNPVNPSSPSICFSGNGTCVPDYQIKGSAGIVNLRDHGPTTMEVGTCFSEPCTYKDVHYIQSGYIAITN